MVLTYISKITYLILARNDMCGCVAVELSLLRINEFVARHCRFLDDHTGYGVIILVLKWPVIWFASIYWRRWKKVMSAFGSTMIY